jgi:hypothetical protein
LGFRRGRKQSAIFGRSDNDDGGRAAAIRDICSQRFAPLHPGAIAE